MRIFVLTYFVLILCNVLYNKLSLHKFNKFDVISNNSFIIGISLFSVAIGGTTIFGITHKAYIGAMEYCYGLILSICMFDFIFGIYIYPKLIGKFKGPNLGSLLSNYYGEYGKYLVGFGALVLSIGFLAAQINILGNLFAMFNISKLLGYVFALSSIILYTILGGKNAMVLTGRTHFFLTISGIILITFYGLKSLGLERFLFIYNNEITNFSRHANFDLVNILLAALGFSCLNLSPASIKRSFLTKKSNIVKRAFLIKNFAAVAFIIVLLINGLMAKHLLNAGISVNALIMLIETLLPNWLQAFAILGIFSAILATSDAEINVAIESIEQDIFPFLYYTIPNNVKKYLHIFSIFIVLGASLFIALQFNDVINLMLLFSGFWFPCIGIPIIVSLYNIILPKYLFVLISILSFCIFCYLSLVFLKYKFYSVIISTAFSISSFFIYWIYKRGAIAKE